MQTEFKLFDDGQSVVATSEEWRTVPDFPRYEVSSMGRFRNRGTGRFIGGSAAHNGYLHITVTKDGKPFTKLCHRLVASAFLEQPSAKHTEVNHKNKDRADNRLSNLEWMTRQENSLHAWHS